MEGKFYIMIHSGKKYSRAMTLVEILMCCIMIALVSIMIFNLFGSQTRVYKDASASQQLQESVRRLIMYLESDIKMSYTFESLEDQKMVINIFSAPPDISDTTDPANTAKTVKCEYSYDAASRTITRTLGSRIRKFDNISEDLQFKALTFNPDSGRLMTFDFDPASGNHQIIGIKLVVRASKGSAGSGRNQDFKMVRKFFSRNRHANFLYGPEQDSSGSSTGRTADAANEFNKNLGYFSTIDCDPSY
jgi:type II secretory pathway pseudopilin PulG